jgi:L-fuconolactonase
VPDCPIVDAHVHLWDQERFRMPWLDALPAIDRPFGPADFREHTRGLNVAGMVYVEVATAPAYGLLEAQWALAQADQEPRLQGIVAFAPIEFGDRTRVYLEALAALGPRVKGVRRLIQGETDPGFCLEPAFVRGVSLLPEFGFSFDLCITHPQLPAAIELVRRCPDVSFVLDHIAKPDIAAGAGSSDPWRRQLRTLAEAPNIVCKISGLVTEANHASWKPDDLAPYVAHVLDVFGEDRVLFGGDWPVMLLASSYPRWVDTLDTLTASLSAEAKRKLWCENAARTYRLDRLALPA